MCPQSQSISWENQSMFLNQTPATCSLHQISSSGLLVCHRIDCVPPVKPQGPQPTLLPIIPDLTQVLCLCVTLKRCLSPCTHLPKPQMRLGWRPFCLVNRFHIFKPQQASPTLWPSFPRKSGEDRRRVYRRPGRLHSLPL